MRGAAVATTAVSTTAVALSECEGIIATLAMRSQGSLKPISGNEN
jgi:hypothetical protein